MNRPEHYETNIDTLDYMKANMSQANYEGFLAGNVLKYISRYPKKNGLEDLEKAADYLRKLIDFYKNDDKSDEMNEWEFVNLNLNKLRKSAEDFEVALLTATKLTGVSPESLKDRVCKTARETSMTFSEALSYEADKLKKQFP